MKYVKYVKGGHKEVPALAACRDDPVIPEPEVMFTISLTILAEVMFSMSFTILTEVMSMTMILLWG